MRVMGWSWEDLEATPAYVRRFCWDFACLQSTHEAEEIERSQMQAQRDQLRAGG